MRCLETAVPALILVLALPVRARAGAYEVTHPVFPVSVSETEVGGLRAATDMVMGFTPAQIDEWIVPRTTWFNIDCPNCDGGTASDANRWLWSPDTPDRITCKFCAHVYPSAEYPEDRVTTVTDSAGQTHEYRYFEGGDGYKHYMTMRVENCWKLYMEQTVQTLARVYAATGEEPYAEQAARILYRLAEVYRHYNPHGIENWSTMAPQIHDIQMLPRPEDGIQPVPGLVKDLPGYRYFPPLGDTPYPYCASMRGDGSDNWFYSEMPPHLAQAYDLIAASAAFETLSIEKGSDTRLAVEEFFRATVNYARTFPIFMGNMDPVLIRGLAIIGRIIGEPEFVHDALRRVKVILEWQFFPDAVWRECSPSYYSATVAGLRSCLEGPLMGYSDPDGYVNPVDGLHIQNLDASKDVPFLTESQAVLKTMNMPDGNPITIHDAWARESLSRPAGVARAEPFATRLFWGMGHAMLGIGAGRSGVQANLHFSGSYGHAHADNLDLMLWGGGLEVLSDIGYTHTTLRPFSVDSLSHNLVVVDEADQRGADGALVSWAAVGDRLRFCEARAEQAYPGTVSEYRRSLTVIGTPEPGGYVVDVFRVAGGSKHDWCLHGSADHDQTLSCSMPTTDLGHSLLPDGRPFDRSVPGQRQSWPTVVDGVNILYGLYEDLRAGSGDSTWTARFAYTDADMPGLTTTVLGQPGTTVYAGTLPSIRRARETNGRIHDYRMPALLVRREAPNLRSVFVAVHEPSPARPQLVSVSELELVGAPEGAVGIVCQGRSFTDYHLLGPDAAADMHAADGQMAAAARHAMVRVVDGEPVLMAVLDGSEVGFGGARLHAAACPEADVVAVRSVEAGDGENALVVAGPMAQRAGMPMERCIVTFGDGTTYGLETAEVRTEGEQSVIVLSHRPGFALTDDGRGATQTHHPRREIAGIPRLRIPNVLMWEK